MKKKLNEYSLEEQEEIKKYASIIKDVMKYPGKPFKFKVADHQKLDFGELLFLYKRGLYELKENE
jgi:hypothetical protein